MTAAEWQRLKLTELKAKCKEVGLSSYSKLTKAALIQLLTEKSGTGAADFKSAEDSIPSKRPERPLKPVQSSSSSVYPAFPNPEPTADPLQSRPSGQESSLPNASKTVARTTATPATALELTSGYASCIPRTRQSQGKASPGKFQSPTMIRPRDQANSPQTMPTLGVNQSSRSNTELLAEHLSRRVIHSMNINSQGSKRMEDIRVVSRSIETGAQEALLIALRFWTSRLHTCLQSGTGRDRDGTGLSVEGYGLDVREWPAIMDCISISSNGEIWQITTTDQISYVCLGANGEIIDRLDPKDNLTKIRQDWQAYLQSTTSLLLHLKTKTDGEFPQGIHRSWRPSTAEMRQIAERAVFSSCVMQSFSGTASSAIGMEADWLGTRASPRRGGKVELFLPESHQILSAHLAEHPSVAIIQRGSGAADYTLRETGQLIGSEDGIVDLWQGILGCDDQGRFSQNFEFWSSWDRRCIQ